jgi:RHS repeat-associated protein
VTDNTGSTTNLYDAAGRLWGIDYPSGATVRYQLDLLDRITAITNKASTGGAAYVTRYQYGPTGNITNVVDPFNGNSSFEYDRVDRRTKRTLPNGIVTEWQYNWKDQVTNITHMTSGGTTLASVLYERAAGGEPTKITREDGSYVTLQYDSALRLTNEIYYTNSVAQTTNSYGYDASGSRVRLVTANVTYTNAVSAGYRVTQVKTNGNVVETYDYDSGGRVTNIARSGITLKLGYNSADQVAGVTNGANWVTYRHDANGRRTISTNSAGTVRRLLVASTPGTDLESPHLIANAGGTLQQGYVYLGDDPILRYTSSGTVAYYLEDSMGSVIGLAPSANPGTNNTTRLFYDGFGNSRATNGPPPTLPPGAGGDFRFHGAWLEESSGLYNMRRREYDPRLGRFASRDPVSAEFREPEGSNPYAFANSNPLVYIDPSGQFLIIEFNITEAIEFGVQAARAGGAAVARRMVLRSLGRVAQNQLVGYLKSLVPLDIEMILGLNPASIGSEFQRVTEGALCDYVPGLRGWLYLEPQVLGKDVGEYKAGDVRGNGVSCNERTTTKRKGGSNSSRPDLILSAQPPLRQDGKTSRGFLIGEIKLSGRAYERAYVGRNAHQPRQWEAIKGYANHHTYSHTALLISLYHVDSTTQRRLKLNAAKSGVFAMFVSVMPDRKRGGGR